MPAVCACEVVRHFARGQEQDFKGLAMVMTSLAQTQCQIFLEGEGDRWFDRNRSTLNQQKSFYENETIKRVLGSHRERIGHILEIGCGNGVKLADLCQFFAAQGHGIDPSSEAVREGMDKFPNVNVHLDVSIASHIPHGDASMDLVYFGFCLYLVDRTEILKAVAEADRVLKSGGFLAILDFDPGNRHKRAYHHKPGLFSYKTSYADFFTASGHYYLVAKDSFSHSEHAFSLDSDERVSICILYKEPEPYGKD